MKKGLFVGSLVASILLLGACQKSDTDTTVKSTKQTTSIEKKSSSTSSTVNSSTDDSTISKNSLEKQNNDVSGDESNTINTARKQLVGNRFTMVPSLYDGIDANQAMEESKAPQNLMHDGMAGFNFTNDSTVRVELAGTYRPDYDAPYTLTNNMLIIEHRKIPYSINNGIISFDSWTTDSNGHSITWSFGPEKDLYGNSSSENNSDTNVDTKNLTSQQLKEWVGAVLDKQFSMGRSSFPYKLSIENKDGYAYVRVNHSTQQVDTIDMFRINSSGQLEEQDLSNGYPATYKVVSSKFMDTSEVTVMNN
ncbi:hypothetical protein ACTXNW_10920 [Enterococcus malodoratus]|uniref:hypothetical protein n=1 Tax=Enterococcus malodoratus TaxID=71451 RepID=UPI003FD5B4B7